MQNRIVRHMSVGTPADRGHVQPGVHREEAHHRRCSLCGIPGVGRRRARIRPRPKRSATADDRHSGDLDDSLVSPLSLEVDRSGVSYVSQNFAGLLTRVDQRGTASVIASTPGFETSAVSSRNGTVYFAKTAPDHSSSVLMARSPNGTVTQLADLWAHENSENPDSVNAYGFSGLDADCIAQFPPAGPMMNAPAYNGIVDTNPYSSLA